MLRISLVFIVGVSMACPGVKNCLKCFNFEEQSKCQLCEKSKWNFMKKECEPIKESLEFCKVYDDTPHLACLICDYGFGVNKKFECQPCIKGCAKCDSDLLSCDSCFDGLNFEGKSCKLNSKCPLKQCEMCHKNKEQCFKCVNGYSLSEGKCIKGLENCLRLSDEDNCDQCLFGFYLTDKFKCIANDNYSHLSFPYILFFALIILIGGVLLYNKYSKKEDIDDEESYLSIE